MAKTTKTPTISAAFILAAAIVLVAFPIKTSALSPAAAPGSSGGVAAAPGPFSGAPGPALDCVSYLLNLSDCLTYVEAGSNQTKPDKACCPELAHLVETQPVCLCQLLAHPERSPLPIDLPKAKGLPAKCKVDASPSLCSVLGVPVGAPAPAPAPAPASASASVGGPLGSSPETSSQKGQLPVLHLLKMVDKALQPRKDTTHLLA
nr:non-specific lipid transfer protein GPI-anchored 2-like [Coffea arabica]